MHQANITLVSLTYCLSADSMIPKLSPDEIIAGGTFVHCVIFLQLISKLARNIRAYLYYIGLGKAYYEHLI